MDTPTPIPVHMDDTATGVVRLAAELGAATSDDVFVSFTSLLIALLLAETDLSRALLGEIDAGRVPFPLAAILERHGPDRETAQRIAADAPRQTEASWPSGRPTFSVSAKTMLEHAVSAAGRRAGAGAAVSVIDLLTAYLFHVPPGHVDQVREWQLAPTVAWFPALIDRLTPIISPIPQEWRDRLASMQLQQGGAQPAAGIGIGLPLLSGFDPATSTILRLSWVLADRAARGSAALITSELLLIATVEAVPLLASDAAEVGVLLVTITSPERRSQYEAKRNATVSLPADLNSALQDTGTEWPRRTRNTQSILAAAHVFAQRTTGVDVVSLRHLLAAQMIEEDGTDRSSIGRWLDPAGGTDQLREALARVIRDFHPEDRHEVWTELLVGQGRPVVTTVLADTIPDDPRTQDALGFRRYTDALGALIAAADQKPPLSIAVFGPWGSGKSFFMAMIRSAVRDFCAAANKAASDDQQAPFLRRVVQIEFNAWHYVEGNLWASLVHAILENLQKEFSPDDDQNAFQMLLKELSLREAAEAAAQERLREAEQRKAEAVASLDEANKIAEARRQKQTDLASEDVLTAFRAEALVRIRPATSDADARQWIQSVGESVVTAANYLGRPELAAQVPALQQAATNVAETGAALHVQIGQVQDALDEARASARQGAALWSWLANARFEPRALRHLLYVGLVLTAGLLLLAFVLEHWGASIVAAITALASFVAPLIASLTALVVWARKHLAEASKAFAVLESVRDRVEAARTQRLSEHDVALQAAHRAAADAESEASRRRAELEAAEAARRKSREDLVSASTAQQMKQFVAQRLADREYLRHLGLIHMVRGDMERLGRLLNEVQPKVAGAEPPIERIVLYIDDLDRCPPQRVVEVLEAVHLLLAFPLFVVVVGVDIRWVSQALQRRYPEQLGGTQGIASPIDYLEKVFQIPFWLPPMDPLTGRRLLTSAIGAVQARLGSALRPNTPGGAQSLLAVPDGDTRSPLGQTTGLEQSKHKTIGTLDEPSGVDIAAIADALVLTPGERELLLDMADGIGISPRRAKRFANLYRLLKASLSPAERRRLAPEAGAAGSYPAALILLAATTGAPSAARCLLQALSLPDGKASEDKETAPKAAVRLKSLIDAVKPPASERAAFDATAAQIVKSHDPEALLRHLEIWAPRVGRFLFDNTGI